MMVNYASKIGHYRGVVLLKAGVEWWWTIAQRSASNEWNNAFSMPTLRKLHARWSWAPDNSNYRPRYAAFPERFRSNTIGGFCYKIVISVYGLLVKVVGQFRMAE